MLRLLSFFIFIAVSLNADSNVTDWDLVGLTQEQWNNQLATVANNIGFTLVFLISFLAILVMRR
jgi:inner membrane protein involved in colicin E2 resistance